MLTLTLGTTALMGLGACAPQQPASSARAAPASQMSLGGNAPGGSTSDMRGHDMSSMDMQSMMAHCAQMRRQGHQGHQGMTSADMQRMMAQCDQMDRMHGAPARR